MTQAQAPAAGLMPVVRSQFLSPTGVPLAGGSVSTFAAGTTTPLATYADSSGLVPNANPTPLDAGGFATIWLGPSSYKIVVKDSGGVQQYSTDNVSDLGLLVYRNAVLLVPGAHANQTIIGPLTADFFSGNSTHTTSPGVRIALLDPLTVLDTANPPTVATVAPSAPSHTYTIPDPGASASFVMSPNAAGANILDCTQSGLTCKRTAYVYFEGGGCNNTTPAMGWDTFGSNSPTPACLTGTNTQKGILALPSAATIIQQNVGTGSASTTCTTTYPAGTGAGDLLEVELVADTSRTVSGITDGTNVYTRAINAISGAIDTEIWYFNGSSTAMPAGTTLTVTLSGAGNCALNWKEYNGILTAGALDKTANQLGVGTAVSTGTTAGTAQNTELVLAAVGTNGAPTITTQAGWVGHTPVSQGSNVTVVSQGLIQQTTATQIASFTLGTSQTWASAIATFKVNVQGTATAQRQFALPAFFDAAQSASAAIKWLNSLAGVFPINVKLGATLACSADGGGDDPAFNTPTTATAAVNGSVPLILNTTSLNALSTTGCSASNLMHFQIQRLRYDPNDTYEGWVYVSGAALQFGITR